MNLLKYWNRFIHLFGWHTWDYNYQEKGKNFPGLCGEWCSVCGAWVSTGPYYLTGRRYGKDIRKC